MEELYGFFRQCWKCETKLPLSDVLSCVYSALGRDTKLTLKCTVPNPLNKPGKTEKLSKNHFTGVGAPLDLHR